MSSERDWRVIVKEQLEKQSPQNDSLELGDSWREMPRRTEGGVNKTSGLYRRSTVTQLPVKNLYNFIIEQQPTNGRKTTDPGSVKEAPVIQPPKLLVPSVVAITSENVENSDFDFSQFLPIESNQAATSTPYPLRQIDVNKSPNRNANVQRRPADSPKKLFAPTPTRIPIITPRTSRIPSDSIKRAKLHIDRQKMSSPGPEVSSTVHNVGDDDEPEPKNYPVKQVAVESNRVPSATENANQNCLPFDEDQHNQPDAGTKNSDEAVFRLPEMVRRLVKQKKSDLNDDQSKLSNSQRNKKTKPKVKPLLESYMKVGETIINRTNSIPLESSTSSSSRRRLYKKGDSCNEEDILKQIEPLGQPSFVLNPISAGDNGTFTKVKSISVQSVAVEDDPKSDTNPNVNGAIAAPEPIAENQLDAVSGVQGPSSKQQDGVMEKDSSDANSIDQQNHMSDEHSNKQVLEEILEDWSDTAEPSNDDENVDHSDSGDSQKEVRLPINSKPETESKVRQARSKNQKNQNVDTDPSKTNRIGAVRSKLQQIGEDVETDEDELTTTLSLRNQTKNASDAKRANNVSEKVAPTKSKLEPVHSTHHEVVDNEYPESDDSQQSVEQPSNKNVKLLRTKAQRTNLQKNKIQPPNTSRSRKRNAENETDDNEVEVATKSKKKAKEKRRHVQNRTDSATTSKDRDVPESDDESEAIVLTKPQTRPTRKKRLNVGDDETEADGKKTKIASTSKDKGKKQSKADVDVDGKENELATISEDEEKDRHSNAEEDLIGNDVTEPAVATRSTGRKKNKRSNVDVDSMETGENEEALPQTKTRKKRLNIENDATEASDDNEPEIGVDDRPAQDETDDNGNRVRSTNKLKSRQSKKRKHQSIADAKALSNAQNDDLSVGIDSSVAKKRKKMTKWEKKLEIFNYDSIKHRELASGVRHSARERRLPNNNLLLFIPQANVTFNRSALRTQNDNVQPSIENVNVQPKIRRTRSAQSQQENVFSMLLNGSIDNEPPLITRLGAVEITQGFHKTVKNNLVIHHIPGETGPSYGYFTLESGVIKRACRITWNLHIHVVSGPILITTDDKTEQMVTGSFASLPSGTKYSLRNDGENSALVFFCQRGVGTDSSEQS